MTESGVLVFLVFVLLLVLLLLLLFLLKLLQHSTRCGCMCARLPVPRSPHAVFGRAAVSILSISLGGSILVASYA